MVIEQPMVIMTMLVKFPGRFIKDEIPPTTFRTHRVNAISLNWSKYFAFSAIILLILEITLDKVSYFLILFLNKTKHLIPTRSSIKPVNFTTWAGRDYTAQQAKNG